MRITLSHDRSQLILTFRYDPAIIAKVKELPSRWYDKDTKTWRIQSTHVKAALAHLVPLGFWAHGEVKDCEREIDEKAMWKRTLIERAGEWYKGSLPLYEFQKIGALFLEYNKASLLGDEPGLGKTLQTIAALQTKCKRVLVVCPASLKYNWQEEIFKWSGLDSSVIDGKASSRAEQWSFSSFKHTIANYELIWRDWDLVKEIQWDAIVCDEAQKISNPETKITKAIKGLSKLWPEAKRIALTGTPVSNTPVDIWSIVDWLVPRYLGHYGHFRNEYCVVDDESGRVVGYRHLERLNTLLDPIMLRRRKEEVLHDFPKKTLQNIRFALSSEEEKIYAGVLKFVTEEIRPYLSGIDTRSLNLIPVKMLRLKQVTGHPALLGEKFEGDSSKLSLLKELLEPIVAAGHKAIIFTQFAEMAKILRESLSECGYDPLIISGEVSSEDRQKRVNLFQENQSHKVIIMTEAGGQGLNLQAASYVFHYDSPWSIAKLEQREGRAHRIGQEKPVTVYNLIARNTIDEYVLKVLARKNKLSLDILGDEERLESAGLSEEDIKSILRI